MAFCKLLGTSLALFVATCLLLLRMDQALRPPDQLQLRGASVQVHTHLVQKSSLLSTICGQYDVFKKSPKPAEEVCDDLPLRNLCDIDAAFCTGTLNYSRCEMPQLPMAGEDDWDVWVDAAATDGISVKEVNMSIGKLVTFKPSQAFLDTCKICSIAYSGSLCFADGAVPTAASCEAETGGCFCSWTSGISVTEDGHVLDGHHRWAAARILLEDGFLKKDSQATVEYYDKENGTAAIPLINVTAAANPEFIEYTDCADEEVTPIKSGAWRAGFSISFASVVLVLLLSAKR
mmetsp:Transcript_44371/g.77974  ORF Transcript_44371/g.77974 Transcript_44371/m.77974 type:complete len:290 (+) Transcript_44371:185-1054(+)